MGTNYYLHKDPCAHCGRSDERKHIGKSSAGWVFSLHVYPGEIDDLRDWLLEWNNKGVVIKDEYGAVLTPNEMSQVICARSRDEPWNRSPYGYNCWPEFHRVNQSEQGPSGMLRHQVDGRHCIGHGSGTWDLMVGEFS